MVAHPDIAVMVTKAASNLIVRIIISSLAKSRIASRFSTSHSRV
jgi:hypothetical protein